MYYLSSEYSFVERNNETQARGAQSEMLKYSQYVKSSGYLKRLKKSPPAANSRVIETWLIKFADHRPFSYKHVT